jgi:hypothetical protein
VWRCLSRIHYDGSGALAGWIGDYLQILDLEPHLVMQNGFLLLDGKPLAESQQARTEDWEAIICQRHRAAIWLVGEEPVYTELDVDT